MILLSYGYTVKLVCLKINTVEQVVAVGNVFIIVLSIGSSVLSKLLHHSSVIALTTQGILDRELT